MAVAGLLGQLLVPNFLRLVGLLLQQLEWVGILPLVESLAPVPASQLVFESRQARLFFVVPVGFLGSPGRVCGALLPSSEPRTGARP